MLLLAGPGSTSSNGLLLSGGLDGSCSMLYVCHEYILYYSMCTFVVCIVVVLFRRGRHGGRSILYDASGVWCKVPCYSTWLLCTTSEPHVFILL